MCVCWSPDGKYILTGGQDDLVTIWSLVERQIVARCAGHHSWVTAVAFDPWRCDERNYRFGTAGEDCRLLLWDFNVGMLHRPKAVGLSPTAKSSRMCTETHRRLSGTEEVCRLTYHYLAIVPRAKSRRDCDPTLVSQQTAVTETRPLSMQWSLGPRLPNCHRLWYVLSLWALLSHSLKMCTVENSGSGSTLLDRV